VLFFGRDPESTRQVWSSTEGYPGDPDYREYYRDVGFDLDREALGACAHPMGIGRNTGIKYHRVTGSDEKQPYVRKQALLRAREHGKNFFSNRRRQVGSLREKMDRAPLVVAPYDAELFGHWWYEGPEWLGHVLRNTASDGEVLGLSTPADYLARHPVNQHATPSQSSWGYKGYSEMWLNGKNDWVYPHLHAAADRMVAAAGARPEARGLEKRALDQAARELLLAQASDWAFIMSQGTVVPYAVKRTQDHLERFHRLLGSLEARGIDEVFLSDIETKDNLFPELDYRVYRADYRLDGVSRSSGVPATAP
jgi:1,4-alpha-glucan branching enzyme